MHVIFLNLLLNLNFEKTNLFSYNTKQKSVSLYSTNAS